jgi:hypothetical protein
MDKTILLASVEVKEWLSESSWFLGRKLADGELILQNEIDYLLIENAECPTNRIGNLCPKQDKNR